jgi:hypothetical protein
VEFGGLALNVVAIFIPNQTFVTVVIVCVYSMACNYGHSCSTLPVYVCTRDLLEYVATVWTRPVLPSRELEDPSM